MKKITYLSLGLLLPAFAFAEDVTLFSLVDKTGELLNRVIPVLLTLAVVYFIWGVIQYTISGNEEAKSKARSGIITGLIGLFVIISFWGIVYVIQDTTGVRGGTIEVDKLPKVNF